ncbi:MAG: ABC transporter ATP-binding protein [Ectothiorhodospiraceae bacterium AqS1]|nr:ABC transporter ATP-binding protein [Ectothiorhodospiraceae bacterium AqS1]
MAAGAVPALEFQGISGGYGGAEIVHDISIRIEAKEIVTLIGPNGAGKSSVMNATFGRLQISGGRILLKGEEITGIAPEQAVRRGISYVPQVSNIFPNLTVQENLEIGAWVRRDDPRPRMEEMFTLFPPLFERRRIPAGALSGGQRQMAAMAKALMVDPEILLLDEPTAGLSPKFRGEIFAVIRKVNAQGIPILMVEQNARQALGIADRGYVLVDGHCRMEGSGKELLANPEVGAMFLGRRADEQNPPGHPPEAGASDPSTSESKSL